MILNEIYIRNDLQNKNSLCLFFLFLNKKNKDKLKDNKKQNFYELKYWNKTLFILCKDKKNYKSLIFFKNLLLKKNIFKIKNDKIFIKFKKAETHIQTTLAFKMFKQIKLNLYFINSDNYKNSFTSFKSKNNKILSALFKSKENYNFNDFTFNETFFYYDNLFDYRFYFTENPNDKLDLIYKNKSNLKKKIKKNATNFFRKHNYLNVKNDKFIYFFSNKLIIYDFDFNILQTKKYYNFFEWKDNFNFFLKYLVIINDKNVLTGLKINYNFLSNIFLKNLFNVLDSSEKQVFLPTYKKRKYSCFNNYYPISFTNKITYNKFFSNFKNNYDLDFVSFTNKFVLGFLEKNFKKNIYVKYVNNYYNNFENYYLDSIIFDYKNFQPAYWKTFLVKDFINILWYSFFLKDLTMISSWISIFMEKMHFKNHKKFLSFFSNFINKYSDIFVNVLKIKGFFFDIRGKVGVTGSSKKRHLFFMFGSINKSSKKNKINFNQSLVRTYSGVMGLTYIINY